MDDEDEVPPRPTTHWYRVDGHVITLTPSVDLVRDKRGKLLYPLKWVVLSWGVDIDGEPIRMWPCAQQTAYDYAQAHITGRPLPEHGSLWDRPWPLVEAEMAGTEIPPPDEDTGES